MINNYDRQVEVYDVGANAWYRMPQMLNGRHAHASCLIDDEWLYLMCGFRYGEEYGQLTIKYCNFIERIKLPNDLYLIGRDRTIFDGLEWENLIIENMIDVLPPGGGY